MTTRKKKKQQPKLSPFTQITPIMPDSDKSIENFNTASDVDISGGAALGESVSKLNIDKLKVDVVTTTIDYLVANGLDEDDASAYTDFDIEDTDDIVKVEVRVDSIGMDMEGELCEVLSPIVAQYDSDAYFDLDYPGILVAYINKDYTITESALSSQDKNKLKDFVDKTEDTDEIEIFMRGLMSKSKDLR